MADRPSGLSRWPLVRGVVSLVESLRLGSEALRFSVDQLETDFECGRSGAAQGPFGFGSRDSCSPRFVAFRRCDPR